MNYIPQPGHKFTVDHPKNKILVCIKVIRYWIFAEDHLGMGHDLIKHWHKFYLVDELPADPK